MTGHEIPDSLESEDGLVVLNPSAVGNPDETPIVWVGADLHRLLNPCGGDAPSRNGYCGGVNGYHADDCPDSP
jgi:hypothetical protein